MMTSKLDAALGTAAFTVLGIYVALLVWFIFDGRDLYQMAKDFQVMGAAAVAFTGAALAYRSQMRKISADAERDSLIAMNVSAAALTEVRAVARDFIPAAMTASLAMRLKMKPEKFSELWANGLPGLEAAAKRAEATTTRLWPMLERCHPSRHKEISNNLGRLDQLRGWVRLMSEEDAVGWVSGFVEANRNLIVEIDPQSKNFFDIIAEARKEAVAPAPSEAATARD